MISLKTSLRLALKKTSIRAIFLCMLLLQACSINLTTLNNEHIKNLPSTPLFKQMNLYYAGQKYTLSSDILNAYSSIFDTTRYSPHKCYATANIIVTIEENTKKSRNLWYLGSFIPFWPALPVNEDWTYKLNAKIICEETIVHHLEFTESSHIEAFWFGALRSDLVNNASQEIHNKIINRLKFETSVTRQADFNSASDYIP